MAWPPSVAAMHIEVVASDASPRSVLVEHFNDPFEFEVSDRTEASLHKAAHAYLKELHAHPTISPKLQLPQHWRDALDPSQSDHPYFGWVPFPDSPPPGHQPMRGPYGSFRFVRSWDEVAVLFASDRLGRSDYLGSGFGLAMAIRFRDDGGTLKAGFVGVSAALPYGIWALPLSPARVQALSSVFSPASLFRNATILATMASETGLAGMAIRAVRIAASDDQWWVERRATGTRRMGGVDVPHTVTMLSTGGGAVPPTDTITHVAPLIADATARGFYQDPSSKAGSLTKPTNRDLDSFRAPVDPPVTTGPLEYPPGVAKPIVQVMCSGRFVDADRPVTQPPAVRNVTINAGDPPVISDDASAVEAFRHARELVQRLEAYGWTNAADYFRITAPEIRIFYRSGISPGPGKDGRTVNARVIPEGWPTDAISWPGTRPAINIHLAAAHLRVREREPWIAASGARSPAIPLGIAIDRRWMWHEFGHVLLVASTGELEFRFAHSPGDAMAAIASDPDSRLQDRRRGLTFPFVFLPRQHDRCAAHGWSWSGTLHKALASVPDALQPRAKGYASEQILSSSLFRLYRCIGGDTFAPAAPGHADERQRASHYTLYLIMQAMQMMGDARLQAIPTAAKFVHWLRQADALKGTWDAAWGDPGDPHFRRVGGTLWKVIRWAFEAQGLYGAGDEPGKPEQVDIYIQNDRPTTDKTGYDETDYGPGSYVPVPLDWQGTQGASPAWHANARTGITFLSATSTVEVRVGNRGELDATNVSVSLWFVPWSANTDPPDWSAAGGPWTQCASTGPATQTILGKTPPGDPAFEFAFPANPASPKNRYILLAHANCPDDRPNTDQALLLACSTLPTPLVDLVANDNNLGLLVVSF